MMKITEDQLQAQCVEWFRLQYPKVIIASFPNGGKRDVREAVKLKKTGCLAGMPDLIIFKSGSIKPGWISTAALLIELKVDKNKVTKKQKEIHDWLFVLGYYVEVCYTFDEFVKVVRGYFGV